MFEKIALGAERESFIKKVYAHTGLAFLLFAVVEFLLLKVEPLVTFMLSLTQSSLWLIVLGVFMLVTGMAERWSYTSTNKTSQYMALGLYVLAEAIIFIPLIFIAQAYSGGVNLLAQAFILTLALFVGLSAVAIFTKKDFSFLGKGLAILGFVALGLIVAGTLFGFDLGLWFSAGMAVFASLSILYQTSKIFEHYDTEQYVAASLGLFSSFMLLLWYVISIFLDRD